MKASKQELEKLEERLKAKQDEVHKIFEEAKIASKDGDGGPEYDLSKVKCLGANVSPSRVAEKIRELTNELNDIGAERDQMIDTLKAAGELEQPRHGMTHPGAAGGPSPDPRAKSVGEQIVGSKKYQDWAKGGAAGGLSFQIPEMYPSEWLAKAGAFDTLGTKTLFETGAGWAPESLRIGQMVEAVTRPIQLLDIIPLSRTSSEQIVYMEETTRTHAAAEKAEGAAFAESTFALTERTSSVRKITDSVPVTDEQLEDVAQAQSYLNNRITFGLRQRLDGQVLVGNGTAPNLEGLKNVTGIQTQALGSDPRPDAFFKLMTKIRLTGRAMPTHHIVHPTDWEQIRLLRTADGIYIWGNPSEAGPERMWGLPVVQSDADSAGTGYVGSFQPQWVSLFERRGIDVQVGFTGTQFTEGKRTIRGDMRAALVFFRPAAFGTVTGV